MDRSSGRAACRPRRFRMRTERPPSPAASATRSGADDGLPAVAVDRRKQAKTRRFSAATRKRRNARHGGAAASISVAKQRRIVLAARHYLMRLREAPACRFDVVTLENSTIEWLQAAFDAS